MPVFSIFGKIKNWIKKIDLSNWFFGYQQNNNTINIQYKLSVIDGSSSPVDKVKSSEKIEEDSLLLEPDQEFIIKKIQHIYDKNRKTQIFRDTYIEIIELIKYKSTNFWYESVASQFVSIREYNNNFFNLFIQPDQISDFQKHKDKLDYFHSLMQGIKHQRRGDLSKEFRGVYYKKVEKDIILNNKNYEQIFKDYERELLFFLKKYELKK